MTALAVTIWDVQHGSAAWIQTPSGKNIIIDLGVGSYGSGDARFSPLRFLRESLGIAELDAAIITHPHRDHLDDIFELDRTRLHVLARPRHLAASDVRAGNRPEDSPIIDKYLALDGRYTEPVPQPSNPFLPENNGGAEVRYFTPSGMEPSNLNNHSLVTVVTYGRSKLLISGDNESASWLELLSRQDFRTAIADTDILVAAHHGRESGYVPDLFDHISPKLAVVSDGRFCETSATDRYCVQATGWEVHRRGGGSDERLCLTTRNDGHIEIQMGYGRDRPFLSVSCD